MSDKVFDLLEKVYIELQETKKDIKYLKQGQDVTNNRLTSIEMKIENEVLGKIKGLYDDRADVKESLETINSKLDSISEKVEKHDIKIQVIEGGKKKRTI